MRRDVRGAVQYPLHEQGRIDHHVVLPIFGLSHGHYIGVHVHVNFKIDVRVSFNNIFEVGFLDEFE